MVRKALSDLRALFRSKKGERGNVMVSFAVLSGLVFTIAASAMELSNINANKSQLQAANDAAALLAAKKFSESDSLNIEEAKKSLFTNMAGAKLKDVTTNISFETIEDVKYIKLSTNAKYDTIFAGVLSKNDVDVHADSYVLTQAKKVEFAFVLDTTGSLSSNNRIGSLKSAMSTTFDIISTSTGETKFGIVPFNTAVKIEPNFTQNWFEWGQAERTINCKNTSTYSDFCKVAQWAIDAMCAYATDGYDCHTKTKFYHKAPYTSNSRTYYELVSKSYEPSGTGYKIFTRSMKYSKPSSCWGSNCNNSQTLDLDTQQDFTSQGNLNQYNAAPSGMSLSSIRYQELFNLDNGFGIPDESERVYQVLNSSSPRLIAYPSNLKDNWDGCIIDRAQNFDVSAESPNPSTPDSLYPTRTCDDSPYLPKILPLTDDIQTGRERVQAITPNGYTNITIGIQWGMELLSPSEPLGGGTEFFDQETRKIMIIITDGENTRNRYTSNSSEIDFRTKQACQAAKLKGIEVFTVRLEDGDEQLLKSCASSPDNFFDVKQAANLTGAMQAIMTKVSKLRIAK